VGTPLTVFSKETQKKRGFEIKGWSKKEYSAAKGSCRVVGGKNRKDRTPGRGKTAFGIRWKVIEERKGQDIMKTSLQRKVLRGRNRKEHLQYLECWTPNGRWEKKTIVKSCAAGKGL